MERVLADFRSWLDRFTASANGADLPNQDTAATVDLHTLLGQFIALRHEVNLQTKAARAGQEQNAETLRRLGEALNSLGEAQDEAAEAERSSSAEDPRPLLKTLTDVAAALLLARREMVKAQQAVWSSLERLSTSAMPPAATPWWKKWLGVSRPESSPASPPADEITRHVRQLLDSLITGYTMSVQRVERALQQHDLETMECVGQPFDPERMEVMDAVADTGRPSGEVIEEVRRGYLWRGRVFRYALVRVAKS